VNPTITIIGEGVLADLVNEQLATHYQITRWAHIDEAVLDEETLALVLHDSWLPDEHVKAESLFRSSNITWLRGFAAFGEVMIGPLVLPNKQGCSQCADLRLIMAGQDRKEMFDIKRIRINQTGFYREPWASTLGLWHTAYLIGDEVHRFLKGETVRICEKVIFLNLNTLNTSSHSFLPDPSCSVCGNLPMDTASAAEISLKSCLKTNIDSYRCRSIEELEKVVIKDYLDFRMGLLNDKRKDLIAPFADTAINLPLLMFDELTGGRTHSYAESEIAGILEGLERYCGYTPRGKRTVIREKYNNLTTPALNPYTVGIHSEEQYALPGFPFKPFDPDRPINWVWGYSLSQKSPILVPERLAYYSFGGSTDSFVSETSNGGAVGGSLEEAILYGILEVVERDSFLMTWYGQLPIAQLNPHSTNDSELLLMIQRLKTVADFDVHLFNSTTENGIPSIFVIAKNTKKEGINLLCGAAAHLDPVKAAKGAVQELAAMLVHSGTKFKVNKEKYLKMYHDSSLVSQMEDHSMLYGLAEAEHRLSFLLNNGRSLRSFQQEYKPVKKHIDLTDHLKEVLNTFTRVNLDVIVVDQTSSELQRNSLHCVKVLIPGMLPMTFGHHLTRLTGLDRVLNVPSQLGYSEKPLTLDQVNPHPHPFF